MTTLSNSHIEAFKNITTATLTTVLLKKGLQNVWIRGSFPLSKDQQRVVGPAFTLRFIPAREDLATAASWSSPVSTRAAIKDMPEGCIAAVDAGGFRDAGIFGDILCERMKQKNVADKDGAVVVPAGMIDEVLETSIEQETLEEWIMNEVRSSASLPGLYPPDERNKKRYQDSKQRPSK